MMSGERVGQGPKLRAGQRHAIGGDELESGQAIAQRLAHDAEQAHRRGHVFDRDPRRGRRLRSRKKLEHRRRNNAEGAFAAQKKLLQIVARIVLA